METNKILDRIVRELTKNDSAQSIVDNCQVDLLDYYYWEYKELQWEHIGYLTKANAHFRMALQAIKERDEIINEQDKDLKLWTRFYEDALKNFSNTIIETNEQTEERVRQEMLLNLEEQHGISSS